jgi:biopolymer transport protein ExbB/TolQ
MFSETNLLGVLRALATFLKIPVLIVVIFLCAAAVVLAGSLIAECFTERLRLKASLPLLTDKIAKGDDLLTVIKDSGLLKRQKTMLYELTAHTELDDVMLEALARKLISSEENHYSAITRITDVIARLGPMFGLLGTLIPLDRAHCAWPGRYIYPFTVHAHRI